jgi:hypothetical protein
MSNTSHFDLLHFLAFLMWFDEHLGFEHQSSTQWDGFPVAPEAHRRKVLALGKSSGLSVEFL